MQLLILFCSFLSSLECVGKTLLICFSILVFLTAKTQRFTQSSQSFSLADLADWADLFYLLDLQNLRENILAQSFLATDYTN